MEEEAKKIMSSYCAGDYKAVEEAFKQMDDGLVKHAVERARNLGNSAFSKGAYRQAIQHYNEALAGEQTSQKHSLLSNRSACYLLLREYEQALEDARMCIRLDPKYAKGWYRAARVLFETGKFSAAEAAFKASRKLETDECKQKELDMWTERAGKLAHKAKLIDRVTVDYSRFETIDDYDDDDTHAGFPIVHEYREASYAENDTSADGCSIEFSDKLSKEQRRQLELFLTGKVETASTSETSARRLAYDPSIMYSDIPSYSDMLDRKGPRVAAKCGDNMRDDDKIVAKYKAKRIALEAPVALCKFLQNLESCPNVDFQLVTEVKEPKKLADSLEEAVLPAFVSALRNFIEGHLRKETTLHSPDAISWLFLGCGTCVPLVTAARLLDRHVSSPVSPYEKKVEAVQCLSSELTASCVTQQSGGKGRAEKLEEDSKTGRPSVAETPSNSKPISACTVFLSTPLKSAAEQMLKNNRVDHLVNLVQQSVEKMDCAGETADALDCATKDMTKPAQLLVIDPSLLDEALLGRQMIPYVRRARTHLCAKQPAVFPSRATVFVQAFSIHLPKHGNTYNWAAVEAAARWNPYAEATSLKVSSEKSRALQESGGWEYGDVVLPLGPPQAAFTFIFDGPLDNLDQDVPLKSEKDLVVECNHSGILNALVVWYQLRAPPDCLHTTEATEVERPKTIEDDSLIIDCGPKLSAEAAHAVTNGDANTSLRGTPGSFTYTAKVRPCKQAVFWVDPVPVERNQILTLHASHTASRVRFRITSPCESPARLHHLAIPRYHLDFLRDPLLITLYQQAISRVAAGHLKKNRLCLKKYEHLNNEACLSDFPPPCLSILCVGGAPAPLPALAGHAVAAEIVKAAGCAASSWQQRQSNLQTFHVTVSDTWPSSVKTCRRVLLDNANLLLPQCLAPTLTIPREEKWKPIAELTTRLEDTTPAPVADPKDTSNNDQGRSAFSARPSSAEGCQQKAAACDPLLKAKVRECFTCIQKDVRQVKPPKGEEDTTSLITLAEVYRLPSGVDVKAHLEQADAADPAEAAACRLKTLASICVCGLFDNGCLGEGILPLSKFIARVLLVKGRATFVPRRVRAIAALVEVGHRTIEEVDVQIWRTYRYVPDYTSIDLDEATCTLLSDPFLVWNFDLAPSTLASTSSRMFAREQKDFKIPIKREGELNAVAFWFELDVDELLTISTAPACVARPRACSENCSGEAEDACSRQPAPRGDICPFSLTQSAAGTCLGASERCANTDGDGRHCVHRTKAWKQAIQMLPPLMVAAGSTVVVGAAHDSTKMLFRVDPPHDGTGTEIARPLHDSSWSTLLEKQQTLSAGWMKALCGAEDSQNAAHAEQATKAALCIAVDAGRQDQFRIDPQDATSFALTLFY